MNFWAVPGVEEGVVRPYPPVTDLLVPLGRVRKPRAPRLYVPRATVHVVARCNNREFTFTAEADFEVLLTHLRDMSRTYDVPVYAYTLMSNHVHLLLQAPTRDALGRPLRWFMTETAKAFHRTRGRRGHFWERRYHACLVEDDAYALAALRYLDRNPVRAGLAMDPAAYPWSSCAAYALGALNPVITFHPSYLALSPYPKVRQRALPDPRGPECRCGGRRPRPPLDDATGGRQSGVCGALRPAPPGSATK